MNIVVYKNDLPEDFLNGATEVAIDTEAMGLCPHRDRLCLAQFCKGDDISVLVQFNSFHNAKNIYELLKNTQILKIFHYARFDMTMFYKYLNIMPKNVYCTKIASKLVRTYTNKHSLKDLCSALLGIELTKSETCTDWGSSTLSDAQLKYAAEDVIYLHKLKYVLDRLLKRENRFDLAQSCFDFLPSRVLFDLQVNTEYDIFIH